MKCIKLLIGILLIGICLSLQGCVIAGHKYLIGQGSRTVKYYEDGSIKENKIESKIVPDLSLVTIPGGE